MRPFFYGATPGPGMGYHSYYRGGRRPIRLFWFVIGAVSAAAWMNQREKKAITAANSNAGPWEAQPQGGYGQSSGHGWHGHGRGRKCGHAVDREEADAGSRMDYGGQRPMESSGPVATPAAMPSYQAPVAPAVAITPPMQSQVVQPQVDQRWIEERDKVREIGRQASEAVRLFPCLPIESLSTRNGFL